MYKDFLGMLIPALLIFGLVLGIGFLIRFVMIPAARRRNIERENRPRVSEKPQDLTREHPQREKEDSGRKLDEYHV